jgi:hypothetical protein
MRRTGHRLSAASSAFALVATMALAAMWGRSFRILESYDLDRAGQKLSIASERGGVSFHRIASVTLGNHTARLSFSRGPGYHAEAAAAHSGTPTVAPRWRFAGFSFTDGRVENLAVQDVVVPYWFLVTIAAATTIGSAERTSRRTPSGCCMACGYNLTGNVSGVCPECGITILSLI